MIDPRFLPASLVSIDHDFDGTMYRSMTLGGLSEAGLPEPELLGVVKERLKAAVDTDAEAQRGAFLTPGSGQAAEYQEAQVQAAAALKSPSNATATRYPMLAATIGIDIDPETGRPAEDVLGVARCIQVAREAWVSIGPKIRATRLQGKASIAEADTVDGALAAYSSIIWPS